MKKILYIVIIFTLSSCGNDSSNSNKKNKKQTIEGTVTQIFNFILPSAYAEGIDNDCDGIEEEDRLYNHLSCIKPENSQCKGESGERCVFFLDENNKLIASAIVHGINYKISLDLDSDGDSILTMIVEDFSNPKFFRKNILALNEITKPIDVNPESTLGSELKKSLLLKLKNGEDINKDFIKGKLSELMNNVFNVVGNEIENFVNAMKGKKFIANELKRSINENVNIKDLFDVLVSYDEVNLQSRGNEELENLFFQLQLEIDSLKNNIRELINIISEKELEMIHKIDLLNEEENVLLENKLILSNKIEDLSNKQELLGHELAHVVQQNAGRTNELNEIQETMSKIEELSNREELNEEESLELDKLNLKLEQSYDLMRDAFNNEEFKFESLSRISSEVVPNEWNEESILKVSDELKIRVNRIEMALIENDLELQGSRISFSLINKRLESIGIEKSDIKRGFLIIKNELEEKIDNLKGLISRKQEIQIAIENILKRRNQGFLVGASPLLKLNLLEESFLFSGRKIEFSDEEPFKVELYRKGELYEIIFVNKLSIFDSKDGYSIKYSVGEGKPEYFFKRRPDLLSQEWEALIDESVNMVIENPLFQEQRNKENPLYEESSIEGENPLYEGVIDGGINLQFSERTSPCFCTRG